MLQLDFRKFDKTAGKEDALLGISLIHQQVFDLARQKIKESRNKDFKSSISEILAEIDSDSSTTVKNTAVLMLLPFLLKSGSILEIKGKKNYKPSRAEILESFISQVPCATLIESTCAERVDKYKKLGRTIQPYVLFVGKSFTCPEKVFAIVDNVKYIQPTIVDAVDLLFQIFHVTHCLYPEECSDIWMFLQRAFYNIRDLDYDKMTGSCITLLTDLGFASQV